VTARRSGTLRTVSLEGIPLISTIQYAPRSGWAAAVGLPVAALEAPLRASLNQLMIIGILVTAIALLLVFRVARSLTAAALAMGGARRSNRPTPTSRRWMLSATSSRARRTN
jgi:hypothetical protein